MTSRDHAALFSEDIAKLDDASAIEAAQLLSVEFDIDTNDSRLSGEAAAHGLSESDVADLGRLVLLVASRSSGMIEETADALAGAGRKQFIIDGDTLTNLIWAFPVVLQILLARGRKSERKVLKLQRKPDGTEVVEIEQDIQFGISGPLSRLLKRSVPQIEAGSEPPTS
jgi:hypothetical protein